MAVSRRLRFEILRRDSFSCRYCGGQAPDVQLEVDHVIPTALGGGDEPSNLVAACSPCNGGKTSVQPDSATVDDVEKDAVRWRRAIEEAAERQAELIDERESVLDKFATAWESWGRWLPNDWRDSVDRFLNAGLHEDRLFQFVTKTNSVGRQNYWKYFCGCCWRSIAQLQEDARRIIEAEDGE